MWTCPGLHSFTRHCLAARAELLVLEADARGTCLGDFFGKGEFFSVSLALTGNRGKREQMLAAAVLNKNTSLLSCRIQSLEKEDLRVLWSEQTAAIERYNHRKEKSQISQCHNTVDIKVKILKSATISRGRNSVNKYNGGKKNNKLFMK